MADIRWYVRFGPDEDIKTSTAAAKFLRESTGITKARLRYKYDSDCTQLAYIDESMRKWWKSSIYIISSPFTSNSMDWILLKKNKVYVGFVKDNG